jgi:DegV family protein with EDD domain
MSIRIFTDSAADLEPSEFADYHIELIPLSITVDQRVYQADLQFNKQDFFRLLEASPIFPTTSQPAPGEFETIFEEARQQGDEILFIAISSALSGTFQCANVVKEMGGYDNVYLVDSRSATLGMKLLVLHAAWLRDRGFPIQEIAARVERLRSRIRLYAGLNTLEYLQKGGRLSKAAAGLGTLARVKPVVTLSQEGTVQVAGKCLGKSKAMSQIATLMAETPPDTRYPVYGIYSSQDDNLRELTEKLAQKGQTVSQQFGIGPVIGAHIGPGAYGVVYIAKED